MFGMHSLPLFIVSCIMLNLTPGQDTMYIIGRSLAQVRKAGFLSVMGVMTGVLVHTLLAAFGLSAVLASSAIAFSVITTGSIWFLVLVYGATWMTGRLLRRASLRGILKKANGSLFVGLDIKLAISGVK